MLGVSTWDVENILKKNRLGRSARLVDLSKRVLLFETLALFCDAAIVENGFVSGEGKCCTVYLNQKL